MLYCNLMLNTTTITEKQEKALRKTLKTTKLIKRVSISDVNRKQLLRGDNIER